MPIYCPSIHDCLRSWCPGSCTRAPQCWWWGTPRVTCSGPTPAAPGVTPRAAGSAMVRYEASRDLDDSDDIYRRVLPLLHPAQDGRVPLLGQRWELPDADRGTPSHGRQSRWGGIILSFGFSLFLPFKVTSVSCLTVTWAAAAPAATLTPFTLSNWPGEPSLTLTMSR